MFIHEDVTVRSHLIGSRQPEFQTESRAGFPVGLDELFFGGCCDSQSNREGRLDEIAVFDRDDPWRKLSRWRINVPVANQERMAKLSPAKTRGVV